MLHQLDAVVCVLAYVAGAGILLNVLDDLFIDARYFLGRLDRREARVIPEETLRDVPQKRIAIMVPAWKEAEVIEAMISSNLARIDFDRDRYDFFCGTYQNDPETQAKVDAVARRYPNVHKVVVPHDGPTSKADCLNWIYQGILLEERKTSKRFDILLMQDAEDVIHRHALRLYSLLIPKYEFVQTPVFSLPLPKGSLVAATYIDEFAEHHLKDMRVREAIGGLIPSAGVGSAFDRQAFEEIATAHGQHAFNVDSLTEDYEIGLKFRLANRRTHFACRTVEHTDETGTHEEFIATRELFPGSFRASVRQRSRWILGITIQTWAQLGWRGPLPVLYCLWRDRKALITNALLVLAYVLATYLVSRTAVAYGTGDTWTIAEVTQTHALLAWLLPLNFCFAVWRLVVKARFVGRLYGVGHALLCAPRLLLGNLIGIGATFGAVRQYLSHKYSGKPLRWLKTAHEFPAMERLVASRRLGDHLIERSALSVSELDEALELQRESGTRLGEIVTICGLVSARDVTAALGEQLNIPTADLDPYSIDTTLLRRLAEPLAEELDVLPLEERDGTIAIAVSEPLGISGLQRLETALGAPVEVRLASGDALYQARDRAYRRLTSASPPRGPSQQEPEDHLHARPEEVDRRGIARLGIAVCVFHGIVPLRATLLGAAPRVLCAFTLHASARAEIARRLGLVPTFELAKGVRLALASALGSIPNVVDEMGLFGLDAAEWRAIEHELPLSQEVASAVRDARDSGISPLDHLEQLGVVDAEILARARARTFGLRVTGPGTIDASGLLPPRLARAHGVTVLSHDADSVELASPRPSPRLAQQVASLMSPVKVAWTVASHGRS